MAVQGASGGGHDDHHEAPNHRRGKKRYHRYTNEQIQLLEATFNECPHPDEKMRLQLSQELGLTPRQIKFWFQNRRTQMKIYAYNSCFAFAVRTAFLFDWFNSCETDEMVQAKSEMADTSLLKVENDKIHSENVTIKESLNNVICLTCGTAPSVQADCHEKQRLRYENAQLKEELQRVSSIVSHYIGRPLASQFSLAHMEQSHLSSSDLSMVTYVGATQQRMIPNDSDGPSLDLDLLTSNDIRASASSTIHPSYTLRLLGMHKSLIADIATSALDELMTLFQTNEPFWTKSADGRDVLDIDNYKRIFPKPNASMKNHNLWTEASRATAGVMMDSMQLVEMFSDSVKYLSFFMLHFLDLFPFVFILFTNHNGALLDQTKWGDLFPTIVLKARTLEVISSGSFGNKSGSLQLMYEELQVASPVVPIRQFIFFRFCQQIDQKTWAVVDFSYHLPQDGNLPYSQFNSRRLPSGCLIQSLPNGYSKVTWIELVEIEEKTAVHRLYRDLIYSGLAFGAERWVACLQRSCERIACQSMTNSWICKLVGVIPSAEGKKSMMNLAQRMVNNFCAIISPSDDHQWSCVSDFDDFEIHANLYKSTDSVHPNTTVLSAAATVWLPHSPQFVFDFLRDEKNRPKWDVLTNNKPVQEVTRIANRAHPGNCISVLQVTNTRDTNILILQESCTDKSGSLVVYYPVDLPAINMAMNGEEVCVPLLPSGFVITTDGRNRSTMSTSTKEGCSAGSTGSLVTLVLQMVVSSLPGETLGAQSVATISNLIGGTVRKIKAAMN
ncbi:unnamed protein product [Lactuca virosa]|uniref:Uncharacterized protein n=1 Tax=Lactuca virosa TaxID=75947 RepID=A0AAU9LVR9_9ASTR|nr:unnamed protein product [Lactuca virosa]